MMEKLNMESSDVADSNVAKIAALFPQCVTETAEKVIEQDGRVRYVSRYAIDFEKLRAELSKDVLEEGEERYQFTWPDKRAASRLANEPIDKTLRPDIDSSVDFWNTENLYIEGDNLDVLKVLRENYLGKIKMIYIDPPYNTGNDFIYKDDYNSKWDEEYKMKSNLFDEYKNIIIGNGELVINPETNGRYHTNWLNMIYSRLKVARDLLSENGIIFISLDDAEIFNMKKIADELFGQDNFICNFIRKNKAGSGHDSSSLAIEFDYILCYAKNLNQCVINQEPIDIENDDKYKLTDEYVSRRGKYYLRDLDYRGSYSESGDYPITTPEGNTIFPGGKFGKPNTWRWSKSKYEWGLENGYIVFKKCATGDWKVYIKQYQFVDNCDNPYKRTIPYRALIDFNNGLGSIECSNLIGNNIFSYPKPSELIKHLLKIASDKDSLILDYFSGSGSTAHAVMKLNAEDGGHRKFIMVQLPEVTDEKSEARKAGYETICQIGEERIRRAGKKILEEMKRRDVPSARSATDGGLFDTGSDGDSTCQRHVPTKPTNTLDVGFRVLKLDSSNMEDVFYKPEDFTEQTLFNSVDNVKPDRTPLDLLFQVMPELNIELSAKIEEKDVNGKKVFFVDGSYLIATFDTDVNESTVTEIAKMQPQYFVMRDASAANDNVLDNFEQIFRHYSPDTTCKVL